MARYRLPRPVVVDFETTPIRERPRYPPVPVGVSVQWPDRRSRYYAWGHPEGNDSTLGEAAAELARAWAHPDGVLCHNGKFDLDVAEVHLGLAPPPWERCHDTTFLVFLDDPHTRHLGLKEAAEHLLGVPPEERDAVVDWLVGEQPVPGVTLGRGKGSRHPAGAHLFLAPGGLVGAYADGDVTRTEALFRLLHPRVVGRRRMGQAYDRERRLMPVLLGMERTGLRVDLPRLRADVASYRGWSDRVDAWLRRRLRAPDVNLDSGPQLAAALVAAGLADAASLGVTKGGAVATNKVAIASGVTDAVVAAVLQYRAQLRTCLGTFMEPWLATAETSGGYIYTTWHQVKAVNGTKTGRLSSTPNFQNIPKEFQPLFAHEAGREEDPARRERLRRVRCPWPDLPPLPLCRGYVVPYEDGHVLVGRDYSQQEPRLLGHFEDGPLLEQYRADPWIDYHDNAKEHLERVLRRPFRRKLVKNINLGIIYGQGVPSLALKNDATVAETRELRDAIYGLYPGLRDLYDDMKSLARAGEPFRTWGGREVFCEPSRVIEGRLVSFDYRMVNYLIQGSAADAMKEAIIRYVARQHNRGWRLLLQVHDEVVISVPREDLAEAQEVLRVAMESVETDVPLLSEGAWSAESWAAMRDYDKKGKPCRP